MRKIFANFLLLFIFIAVEGSYSQSLTWYNILHYNHGGILYKTHQISDGGYIAVGSDRIGIYYKMFIIKFNSLGDSVWSCYYNLD